MSQQPAEAVPLRLAVIGTPRSGNTWLRRLLATSYALDGEGGKEFAVHDPGTIDWGSDATPYIVQVHLRRDPTTAARLARHGVRVVTPSRHPFDVLISILQYAAHQSNESAQWLLGDQGNENAIIGLDPCHPGFLDYARGPRARRLLEVSPSWCDDPAAISVRYEDLVADTAATLSRVASALGCPPRCEWSDAVAKSSIETLRRSHGRGHVWQARPGLWRSLLTAEAAGALMEVHGLLVEAHGGETEADPSLTPEAALANWQALL